MEQPEIEVFYPESKSSKKMLLQWIVFNETT